jgi:hypothetical protein
VCRRWIRSTGSAYNPGHAYDFGLPRVLDGLATLIDNRPNPNPTRHTERNSHQPELGISHLEEQAWQVFDQSPFRPAGEVGLRELLSAPAVLDPGAAVSLRPPSR